MGKIKSRDLVGILVLCSILRALLSMALVSVNKPWTPYLSLLAFDLLLVLVCFVRFRIGRKEFDAIVGTWPEPAHLLWPFLLGVAYFAIEPAVQFLFTWIAAGQLLPYLDFWPFWQPVPTRSNDGITQILAVVVGCLVAPFAEEFVFRGLMLSNASSTKKFLASALFSSLAFTAMHFKKPELLSIFIFSIGMAFLYRQTGSIWPCFIAHAVSNALSTIQYRYAYDVFARNPSLAHELGEWKLEAALFVLSASCLSLWAGLLYRTATRRQQHEILVTHSKF